MTDKEKANELKDKGNAAINKGEYDEAIKFYSDAIKLDPDNHVLYSNRSAAYCQAGKFESGLEDANTTIRLKTDWAKGYSRKGTALQFLHRYADALEAYREGLKYDPQNQQLKEGVVKMEESINNSRPGRSNMTNPFSSPDVIVKLQADPRTREYFNDPTYFALLAELQQNPQSLLTKFKDERVMTTLSVLLGIDLSGATAEEDSGEEDTVRPRTERKSASTSKEEPMEVELSPEKKRAIEQKDKGNEEYKKKNFETALSHYDKAIELDPTEMLFITNKAAVYFEMKDYESCIKECEKALDVGRENRADFKKLAKAYSRMAGAYHKIKDIRKARTYYEKSLTEHRTPETLKKLQEVVKLIKEEERKAYLDPEKSLEEKNKGKDCFQKGDYPAALKHYTEAINRNPDDPVLFSNRAACYQKLAEFSLALKDCETCIKMDPSFVRGHLRKGMALVALKENAKAALAFQKAMELDPNNQEALDGYRKCLVASSNNPDEIRKQAMNDPEVQKIFADPAMRIILDQMQNDPKAFHEHFKNPDIAAKIQKLVECGLIAIH